MCGICGIVSIAGKRQPESVRRRVDTMLTLVGAHQFMEMYPDAAAAVKSF